MHSMPGRPRLAVVVAAVHKLSVAGMRFAGQGKVACPAVCLCSIAGSGCTCPQHCTAVGKLLQDSPQAAAGLGRKPVIMSENGSS